MGTPEEVTAALTPVVTGALGRVTQMACAFRHAGMRTPEVHTSMRLFAGEVLPALRDVAKPGSAAAPAPWES